MSKMEPHIQKYMTTEPKTIDEETTLVNAQKIMSEFHIRHLPVLRGEKLVGIISDRDVKLALGFQGANPNQMKVKDVEHQDPYQVSPEAFLHDVADEMAVHHYGCALVVQNHKLVGIFTTVDACKTLSDIVMKRYHE